MEGQFSGERPEEGGVVHDLVADGSIAAMVTTDSLHRLSVASKTMADDTARHAGDTAQFVRKPAVPKSQRMEHSA